MDPAAYIRHGEFLSRMKNSHEYLEAANLSPSDPSAFRGDDPDTVWPSIFLCAAVAQMIHRPEQFILMNTFHLMSFVLIPPR